MIGAGASHACVQLRNCPHGILMRDLTTDLAEKIKKKILSNPSYQPLGWLVNEMADPDKNIDVEHLITFFEESPSALHNDFAGHLRNAFHSVLEKRLNDIKKEAGPDTNQDSLYDDLFQMHKENCEETLQGVLTLNYDDFLEEAAGRVWGREDADLDFQDLTRPVLPPLLKLHGSFSWSSSWPLRRCKDHEKPLWIPPGIQKRKDRYPFNIVWGMARDVLDCDFLRVIGCSLGSNDWDLISLIFSTHHAMTDKPKPYAIEIIDSPQHACQLQKAYPYFDIKSLFQIKSHGLGRAFISRFIDIHNQDYEDLNEDQKTKLLKQKGNWFKLWLEEMFESLDLDNPRDEEALRS